MIIIVHSLSSGKVEMFLCAACHAFTPHVNAWKHWTSIVLDNTIVLFAGIKSLLIQNFEDTLHNAFAPTSLNFLIKCLLNTQQKYSTHPPQYTIHVEQRKS